METTKNLRTLTELLKETQQKAKTFIMLIQAFLTNFEYLIKTNNIFTKSFSKCIDRNFDRFSYFLHPQYIHLNDKSIIVQILL